VAVTIGPGHASRPAARGRAGERILAAAVWGTAVFVATAVAATAADALVPVSVAVALVLFAAGCVANAWALVVAAGRSRREAVDLGGLFFLSQGAAPPPVRRRLLGALAVQVVVALVTASLRPYTGLAFGVLVPTFGLGLAALWAATSGTFGPRVRPVRPRSGGAADRREA
jgi:hypothetical protein